MKRNIIIILLIVATIIAIAIGFYTYRYFINKPQLDPVTERGTISTDAKIDFKVGDKNIRVNDFIKYPVRVLGGNVYYIADTLEYGITYWADENKFYIPILLTPVKQNSLVAEQKFMDLLGVTKEEACQLPVVISGHFSVDLQFTGDKLYSMSFCSGEHLK